MEMIVTFVVAELFNVFAENALFDRCLCVTQIGISFSEWQSQFGDTSQIREMWKHGRSLQTASEYSAIL